MVQVCVTVREIENGDHRLTSIANKLNGLVDFLTRDVTSHPATAPIKKIGKNLEPKVIDILFWSTFSKMYSTKEIKTQRKVSLSGIYSAFF